MHNNNYDKNIVQPNKMIRTRIKHRQRLERRHELNSFTPSPCLPVIRPLYMNNSFIHTYVSDNNNNNNKYYYTYYHSLLKPRLVFLAWTAKKITNHKYKEENTLSQHGFKWHTPNQVCSIYYDNHKQFHIMTNATIDQKWRKTH